MSLSTNEEAMSQGLISLGFTKEINFYEKVVSNGEENRSPFVVLKIQLPDYLYLEWMWIKGKEKFGGMGIRLPWDGSLIQIMNRIQQG